MKMTLKIAFVLFVVLAAGCAQDVTAPEDGLDSVSRSIYYRLASWENIKLTWASLRVTETTTAFKLQPTGTVLLRNLAYVKDVAIRYTRDGWKTWSEIKCYYSSAAADNCEYWTFNGPEWSFAKSYATQPLTSAVKLNFDFCVRYKVNGVTYWDNKGGANYHMDQNLRYISN